MIGLLEYQHWNEPVITTPKAGATERWRFVNVTPDTHPIHVHLVHFEIVDRWYFDAVAYKAANIDPDPSKVLDPSPFRIAAADPERVLVLPNEQLTASGPGAPKDVVRVEHSTVTEIILRFDLPSGTVTTPGEKFRYVTHCHILEHEDNEMMRPFDVVA